MSVLRCLLARPSVLFGILLLLVGSAAETRGAITLTGEVNPSDPGDGNLEVTLEVGEGANPDLVDPRATARIDGGSTFEVDEAYIGSDEGFFGQLFVDGSGSLFTIEEIGSTSEPALQIGREGDGYASITGGSHLHVSNTGGDLSIGDQSSGLGRMVVSDSFTLVTIGQDLIVGNEGVGTLEVTGGALLRTLDTTSAGITIGSAANGIGTMLVDGPQTRIAVGDDLTVGGFGTATLTIQNQGVVDADSTNNLTTVGTGGRVVLDGGTLLARSINLNGVLEGDGVVRGDGAGTGLVTVADTARIAVGAGQLLQLTDTVSNQGSVDVEGGELELLAAFTNNVQGASAAPGRVSLETGRVRFSQGLTNQGVLSIAAGASDLHGAVTNEAGAAVLVANDAVATFHDDFTDNGGTISVLAGGNALFLADLTFQASASLALALSDEDPLTPGNGSPIAVAGTATLAGDLTVTVPAGFSATAGDTYTLLEAQSLAGGFATTTLPDLPGNLEFGLVTTSTSASLLVQIETTLFLEGDFNEDGTVDAADYTVWRDGLGTVFQPSDYTAWVQNYGQTISASSGEPVHQTIPEPGGLGLVGAALLGLGRVRRTT